jgi:hypothetical protein
MTDGLSALYQELLGGSYDCVDRIVLNAYFGMAHSPGGFRVWWRALTGSDETLDNAHLMRLAGRFSRRVRGYAKAHDIPVVDCVAGERKHRPWSCWPGPGGVSVSRLVLGTRIDTEFLSDMGELFRVHETAVCHHRAQGR